jgi:hypothetical protein
MAIYSYNRYESTGQSEFAITFDYLSTEHITVYLDGVEQTTGYTIDAGTNKVTFASAPDSGTVVLLKRVTPKTKAEYQAQIVDFQDGSVLTESDLDTAVLGLLYISQEAEDSATSDALGIDQTDQNWTAESKRIKSVATPTGANDAVTKEYVDGLELYDAPSVPQLYSFTATASQTAFVMDPAPTSTDVNSFIVDLDGVVQKPTTDFTISGATLTLGTGASEDQVLTVRNIGVTRDILIDNPSITGDLTVTGEINVSLTATGSTTARTLADRFSDSINVKDFGAVGDGVTDDTAAIQSALTGASRRIFFPEGTYKVTSTLSITDSNVEVDFQRARINFAPDPLVSDKFLYIRGDGLGGTQYTLDGDASGGDETIDVSAANKLLMQAAGWDAGTVFTLSATTAYSNDATENSVAQPGELNVFEQWDGENITPVIPVSDYYTTDASPEANDPYVEKVTLLENITIRGGYITGPSGSPTDIGDPADDDDGFDGHVCIEIDWAKNVLIADMTIHQFHMRAIGLSNVMFGRVQGCHVSREEVDPMGASSHGVSIRNMGQDIIITGCTFYNLRHTLSTNYTGSYPGVTRRITFSHNTVTNSTSNWIDSDGGDAINTHIGTEDVHILNNTMDGGGGSAINIQARSGSVRGNTITNSKDTAILWVNRTSRTGTVDISNNWVDRTLGGELPNGGTATATGIYIKVLTGQVVDAEMQPVIVSNNRVVDTHSHGIHILSGVMYIKSLSVTGNTVYNAGGYGIRIQACDNYSITGNSVYSAWTHGVSIKKCNHGAITGNSIYLGKTTDIETSGMYLENCDYSAIQGNVLSTDSANKAEYGIQLDEDSTYSTVSGNVINGFDDLDLKFSPDDTYISQGLNQLTTCSTTDLGTTGNLQTAGPYGWYWVAASHAQAPVVVTDETYWLMFSSGHSGDKRRFVLAYGHKTVLEPASSAFTGTIYGGEITSAGVASWEQLGLDS